MSDPSSYRMNVPPARSFGLVADAYDRGRPSYPADAAAWLVSRKHARVLELGAGTGKLTEHLRAAGHDVIATDPSTEMLARLGRHDPEARRLGAVAEQIPLASRSVDVVVAGQAFHWFHLADALPEIARVLRPGGHLAVVWNARDERIPWVRRLGSIIGSGGQETDPTEAIDESAMFTSVESRTFRFWQPLTPDLLRDLVASRSMVATMSEAGRARVLAQVEEFYHDYGRGPDGLVLPYLTRAFRTTVLPWAVQHQEEATAPEPPGGRSSSGSSRLADPDGRRIHPDEVDTDSLLIDFR
jgi:SAM-dependent methyltransferase